MQRRKPRSSRQKQRMPASARSAIDSAQRTWSASSCSSSAKKRRQREPRSDAGNRLSPSPSLPPRRQRRPRAHGAVLALRLLSLLRPHQLARPRVPKALPRPAARPGRLVVVALQRVGVRARQRMLRLRRAVVPPHRRGRMRNSRRRRRTRMTGSRLRRPCGSLRDCGGSSRLPFSHPCQ